MKKTTTMFSPIKSDIKDIFNPRKLFIIRYVSFKVVSCIPVTHSKIRFNEQEL